MPEISIVILTLNSEKLINFCLDSIFRQNYLDSEILIIDNNSNDRTVDSIKKNYPAAILIENKKNLGACQARNQAIEIAKGRWILALDCDVILEKDFLKKIMSFARNAEEPVGIFQPKILNMDKKTIYSCGIYLSKLRRLYDVGKGKADNGQFNAPGYIFGACSAAALYRRQMLEEIKEDTGYFDERFFFLVEDVDLALRAQRRGWKALFYPQTICYHAGDSSKTSKKSRQFLCWRNRKLLLKKCQLNKFKSLLINLCYDFPRQLALFLINPLVRHQVLGRNKDNIDAVIKK